MATAAEITARCARCGSVKSAAGFPLNASMRFGLDSWCTDCRRDYAQDRYYNDQRSHKPRSPHAGKVSSALQDGDALGFSRAVCDHVAWYVQRKITEFEVIHHMEAPPHMTAIHTIAKSISAQHPIKRASGRAGTIRGTYLVVCVVCGTEHEARSPTTQYCDSCRVEVRKKQRQAQKARWNQTPAGQASRKIRQTRRAERRLAERAARPPVVLQCRRCGTTFTAERKRKYCGSSCADEARREHARAWKETEQGRESMRKGRRAWKDRQKAARIDAGPN